ncbi:MAG: ASKHA domain-containing protein [Candidatus Omnitrophota bacterium]|nr:ASKHA domain-containing protein [Candidatus Omnitrophota bacterium]
MQEYTVRFNPQGKSVKAAKGTDLLSAAIKCGIVLSTSCGGKGLCGKCRVIVEKGKFKSHATRLVGEEDRKKGIVLACETIVEGDLEVKVPKESVGLHEIKTGGSEEFTKGIVLEEEKKVKFSPLVRKVYLELGTPTADENTSGLERIYEGLSSKIEHVHISTELASLKHLDEVLRDSDYKITVVVSYNDGNLEILTVEPGDTTKVNFGLAFDIGTTTVAGQLIDLGTKNILGTRIAFNKQAVYGSDVITRIIYASEPEGLEKQNKAVLENINEITKDLTAACKVNPVNIYSLVLAGNMTMMHLLLRIDPSNIRKAPYIPTMAVFSNMNAAELGVEVNPKGTAAFLPGVTTYIGGDITAGVLACGLAGSEDISLLADIGTNGEIVLGTKDWMIGAAASAGPAFEGSGLSHGMKAVGGAIEKVTISKDLEVDIETIGGEKPKGICGSGYIDLLCQMLKSNIIGKDGKINRDIKSKRLRKSESNYEFVVSFRSDSGIDRDIVIQEDDIENLKRSKGAIYSAIIALLNKVEKNIAEVKKIYIAGGFGNYLNIENSIFIGLFPDARRDVYEFIGNSSLAGARMSLLSREAFQKAESISKNITYVDLSSEPNYMDEYVASLFFPHTDLGRFPSVRS